MAMPQLGSMFGDAGRRTPVTVGMAVVVVLGAILTLGSPGMMMANFGFDGTLFPRLWTALTYPLVNNLGPIGLVFLPLWLVMVGGTVERDHTSPRFGILLAIIVILSWLPFLILGKPLLGILIPDAALTVIWATRQPNACCMIFGLIPVKSKWIAWLGVAGVLYSYGYGNLLMGAFALISCLIAYLYASNRLPIRYGYAQSFGGTPKQTKAQREKEDAYLNDVFMREQERAERERLRKLFESSLEDDKK